MHYETVKLEEHEITRVVFLLRAINIYAKAERKTEARG